MIIAYFDGSPKSNHICCVFEGEIQQEPEIVNLAGAHTNNEMEYHSMLYTMQRLMNHNKQTTDLIIKGDSELIINQMTGKDKVTAPNLIELYHLADKAERELWRRFRSVTFEWIPREMNPAGIAIEKKQKEDRAKMSNLPQPNKFSTPSKQELLRDLDDIQSKITLLKSKIYNIPDS